MSNDILDILEIRGNSNGSSSSPPGMFRNPFSFTGRIRRTEFGISFIIYFVFYLLVSGLFASASRNESGGSGLVVVVLILLIPMVWFVWAQSAKRCHDLGNSGWYQLIPFYFFWLLFQDGQPGMNEYGDNPKGVGGDMDFEFTKQSEQ